MRRGLYIIGSLVLCASLAQCRGASSLGSGKGKTLATVNGTTITEGDLEFLGSLNPRINAQIRTPFGQKQIVDNLVEQELFYQESVKRGLEHDAKVAARADLYRRVIVAQAVIENEMEQNAKKYYDEHKEEFDKLELSHILIRFKQPESEKGKNAAPSKEPVTHSEAQALTMANQLKERLTKGEDFAKLVKEASEDTGSKGAGGTLGRVWKHEPRLERRGYGPLLEAAFGLKVGEIGGPIKSQEGYHLLAVTKGVETQPFDEAKQAILFKLQGDIQTKLLADLKQKAKITYAEGLADSTKPSTPPVPEGQQPGGPAAAPGEGPDAGPASPPQPKGKPTPTPAGKIPPKGK